jgi:exosome complex protein LRP1
LTHVARARFDRVARPRTTRFYPFARAFARLVARARRRAVCGAVTCRRRARVGPAATAPRDATTREIDAMPAVADDALPDDVRRSFAEFEAATAAIERALGPFLDADRKTLTKELRPLERAEVHCEAARAIVALFGMYLKTLGVDPEKHATAKEMKRVEAYAKKIAETRARLGDGARGASAGERKARVDVEAAAKMIKDGVGSPGDLLKASLAVAGGANADVGEDVGEGKKRASTASKEKGSKKAKKK